MTEILIAAALAAGQAWVARAQPDDLARWNLICYCVTSVSTPHFVVRADSNGRILYYAQDGATRAALERATGQRILLSQLELLMAWSLLDRHGDVYTTSIPVLGPEKVDRLRTDMRRLADELLPSLRADIRAIGIELDRRKQRDHLYGVLFSVVLDGLTWDRLTADKAVPDVTSQEITPDHPFWAGTFWALYPKRDGAPGTNSSTSDSATLLVTWTDRVLEPLRQLHPTPGAADIPVVHRSPPDSIYAAGVRIADRVAAAVVTHNEQAVIGTHVSPQQARLIATHELIWEILDALTREGLVKPPEVLQRGPMTPATLAPLLIVVR